MSPEDPRHGTEAGHEQHLRDNEDPCAACIHGDLIAARRRTKRKAMGFRYQAPLGDIYWRLQALRKQGATYDDIMSWTGVVESQVWRALNGGPDTLVYARTWHRFNDMKVGRIITPLGTTRRIRALTWLGYSAIQIAAESGCHPDTIRDARDQPREFLARKVKVGIADAYERLAVTIPEGATKQDRAGITRSRNTARRNGWLAPLMWDDIDSPDEHPELDAADGDDFDPVVVDRILSGDWQLKATPAERAEVIARWTGTRNELERLTGWNVPRELRRKVA